MLQIFKQKKEDLTDQELLLQYKKGGEMLFLAELYKRYTSLIYGVCLKYLKNSQDAEDAYMSVFEKLVKKVRQHDITNFKSWLHVLVKNHCLEILRKQKKILTVSYDQEFMQNEPFVHPFEESPTEESEKQLSNCLQELELQQLESIQLFYYQNKSYKEIAETKNLPLGKIRSSIQNGRRNLKICMEGFQNSVL